MQANTHQGNHSGRCAVESLPDPRRGRPDSARLGAFGAAGVSIGLPAQPEFQPASPMFPGLTAWRAAPMLVAAHRWTQPDAALVPAVRMSDRPA